MRRGPRDPTPRANRPEPEEGDPSPVRVLYVAGAMRSGSTLLTRLLGEIDGVFGAGELFHFFARAVGDDELCACGHPARDCEVWGRVIRDVTAPAARLPLEGFEDGEAVDRFLRRASYGRHLPATIISGAGGPTGARLRRFRALLGRLYRKVRDVTGARLIVDASKLPAYGWLLRDLPGIDLSVVHLVRDPRAVVHSWSRRRRRPGARRDDAYMNRFGPVAAALLWSVSQAGAEWLRRGVRHSLRIRYRDLANDPEGTLRRILRRTSESGRELAPLAGGAAWARLLSHLDGTAVRLDEQHLLAGNPMRMSTGRIAIEEDRAWTERMTRARQRLVTALTLPFLRRYGMAPG